MDDDSPQKIAWRIKEWGRSEAMHEDPEHATARIAAKEQKMIFAQIQEKTQPDNLAKTHMQHTPSMREARENTMRALREAMPLHKMLPLLKPHQETRNPHTRKEDPKHPVWPITPVPDKPPDNPPGAGGGGGTVPLHALELVDASTTNGLFLCRVVFGNVFGAAADPLMNPGEGNTPGLFFTITVANGWHVWVNTTLAYNISTGDWDFVQNLIESGAVLPTPDDTHAYCDLGQVNINGGGVITSIAPVRGAVSNSQRLIRSGVPGAKFDLHLPV